MKPSKVLVTGCSGIIIGVAFGSVIPFSWEFFGVVFFAALALLVFSSKKKVWLAVGGIFVLFLILGFLRSSFGSVSSWWLVEESGRVFSDARENLISRASKVVSGQEHALFAAMVLGERSGLSEETKTAFNRTGTTHILAISGMNLTIVANLILSFLISIGLWRRQAFWGSLIAIGAFTLLVGAPASAVRAAIMAALYFASRELGRPGEAWRTILLAGTLMILFEPQLLLFDIGFQLSFLAILGMVLFKPFFDALLNFIRWGGLRDLFSMSLAAQLTTWPIVAVNFGTFSSVGILANLVVVPLMPLVMILGLSFILVGWLSASLGAIFLWPAWVILHLASVFVGWLASWPSALLNLTSFAMALFILYYAILALFFVIIRRRLVHEITV